MSLLGRGTRDELAARDCSALVSPFCNAGATSGQVHGRATFRSGNEPRSASAGGPRRRTKAYLLTVALFATFVIGSSRVYLGVHWISDVSAGVTMGAVWVTIATVAYETFRRIRAIRGRSAIAP